MPTGPGKAPTAIPKQLRPQQPDSRISQPQAPHRNREEPCCPLRPSSRKMLRQGTRAQQHPNTMGPQCAPGPLPVVLAPSFSSPRHLCPPESSASESWLQNRGSSDTGMGREPGGRGAGVGGVTSPAGTAPSSHAPVLLGTSQGPSYGHRKPHCQALRPKFPQQEAWEGLGLRTLTKPTRSDVLGEAARAQAECRGRCPAAGQAHDPVLRWHLVGCCPRPQQTHLRSAAMRLKPLYR